MKPPRKNSRRIRESREEREIKHEEARTRGTDLSG